MRKNWKNTISTTLPKLGEFADNLQKYISQNFQILKSDVSNSAPNSAPTLDFVRPLLHILSKPIHSEATDGQAVFLWWFSCGQRDHSRATPPHIHGSPSSVLLPHSHGNSSILLSLTTARLTEGHRHCTILRKPTCTSHLRTCFRAPKWAGPLMAHQRVLF